MENSLFPKPSLFGKPGVTDTGTENSVSWKPRLRRCFGMGHRQRLLARFSFQIAYQPLKRRLVRVMVLPVAEVGDEVLAYLARRIFPRITVEALPIAQRLKPHQPDGKQHPLLFFRLPLARLGDLGVHPLAVHAVLRQNEQQPVMQPNGLVNLFVDLPPALDVVRREPAAHPLGLEIGMQPLSKLLVVGRIANEAGVKLNAACNQRVDIRDELVRNAASAKEHLWNLAARLVDGVNADDGRSRVLNYFETLGSTEIHVTKACCTRTRQTEVRRC